jgi:hypothetical protein
MASTYLSWTPGNTGTRTTFTWSFWVKRNGLGSYQKIHDADYNNDANYYSSLYFKNDDTINMSNIDAGSTNISWSTTRKFRDTSAWYHIVVTFDTTNGTANDRIRVYVNGERETLTGTFAVAQNTDNTFWNRSGNKNWIGAKSVSVSDYLDASLSHFYFIDGTAYEASTFGSTDSTTGEWSINTSPTVTMGTNGFLILKDGNTVTDQSAHSNNWTVATGTLSDLEDNPSNNFATWYADSFDKGNQVSFSNGNNTTADAGGTSDYDPKAWTTLGADTGKYYCEMKLTAFNTGRSYRAGVWFTNGNFSHESNANCFSGVKYTTTGDAVTIYSFGSDVQSGLASFSTGDILGIAVDIDNGTIQYYRNGATYGSQITGLSSNFSGKSMMFCHTGEAGGGRTFTIDANFGNGYFGTTAVSSAGTNASGNGIFEYDVPSGFTALSTKGLNL